MAWVTPIGSDPAQVDYRLGLGHGCVAEGINDAQLDYHTDMRERPLVWVGKGLDDLGIEAGTELTPEDFDKARALVNGYHPITGEQLVAHKKGVPHEAKLALAPLVRKIEGIAREADVPVNEVLTSNRMRAMYGRAQRAVERQGEAAVLRADYAGQLADAAGLTVEEVWGEDVFTAAVSRLTKTITHPDGTQEQVDDRVTIGNLAYDVTLTLDGDFRAAYGLVDDETRAELDGIFTDQAMETFGWLENIAAYGMRGHHGDGQTAEITAGNGLAGWAMFHRTARPVDGAAIGDPHWHVHYTLANMTKGEDGKWSTIAAGGRDLMRHAPVVDRLLQASVRDVLTRRYGVQYRRNDSTGRWEIDSIPDEAIRLFSKRGQGIEAALVEMGLSPEEATNAVRRVAASMTRERKSENTIASDETLASHWRQEALDAGLDPDQITRDTFRRDLADGTGTQPRPSLDELATLLQDVDSGLTAHTRRFSRIDALAAVADALPAGGKHAEIEQLTDQVLEHAGFVKLAKTARPANAPEPTNGERRQLGAEHMANATLYTTRDVVDAEKVVVAKAEASTPDQTRIRVSRATAEMAAGTIEATGGFELSAEQRRELLRITTSGAGLDSLVGPPGSGKTTLMDAVRAAYEAEGLVIAGAATQGMTAQTLQAESGIPSRTIAQWLWRIYNGPGLRGVDVLVLDEAGMIDDRARARLYIAADAAGVKILEIGDPKQLRGVGVGSSFGVVHALVRGGELEENRRQSEADERAAIAAWRRGDYSEALTSWADRDRLVVTETGNEATAAMLASWVDQRQGAPDAFTEQRGLLMVAATNEMVDRLNDGAQALRAIAGELGQDRTYDLPGGRTVTFYEGDYVMVRVNERQNGAPDVLNGYRGVIDAIRDDGSLDVRWERATREGRIVESRVLGPEFVAKGGLSKGYALTIHKSQGLTIGADGAAWTGDDGQRRGGAVLFSVAGADNPGSFVAASRHKLAMWMFLARQDVEGSQDEYLLGLPRTAGERTRRVITKLVDRAKATEINRNDTPVLVDLGLLEDPNAPARDTASAQPPGRRGLSPEEVEQRRAFRAQRHAADVVRRAKAEVMLREEWGEHPAVDRVIRGAAFRSLATVLDRIDKAGGDPRDLLRALDPDDMIAPNVRDASRLTTALVKEAALADPATARPQHRPLTKAQREARAEAAEQAQRTATADLLREEWGEHPAVERVISGPAFGAIGQNLAAAAAAGHDPRVIVRDIDPDLLVRPRIENPSAFAAARIRAATSRPEHADPAGTRGARQPEEPQPLPSEATARLDVLVPSYERSLAQLATRPAPIPAAVPADAPAQPPPAAARRRDAMWPSWLPTPPSPEPLAGRDRAVAAATADDGRRIRARVVELGRDAARNRPDWVEQLGPAPEGAAPRARYLAAVTTIAAYREQHGITGSDPVGPPPPDERVLPAYQAAAQARMQLERAAAVSAPPITTGDSRSTADQQRHSSTPIPGEASRNAGTAADARQRAERLAEQQRRAQKPRPVEDPPSPGPSQGSRPGY
ncbi:MobF family relaxase [Amycolatopsis sp. NPDC051758]|uniref:MobF family relaxase n=1 Tax=Amycolatopsis sp. NPDC051758 TaxID=3363935 RepID=UPI00378C1C1D